MNVILDAQFREGVNAALAEKGWTRSELARRLGMSPPTVTQYLNGQISPGVGIIEKFCAALDLEPHLELAPKKVSVPA